MLATAGMDEPELRQFAFGTEGFNKHLGRIFEFLKVCHEYYPSNNVIASVTNPHSDAFAGENGEPANPEYWRNPQAFAQKLSDANDAVDLAELDAQIDAPET